MTAAFTDILNIGSQLTALASFENIAIVDEAVSNFYDTRHQQNATINILADALYGVMQNEDLKTACYNYLKSGGKHALEPVSILSAVSRSEQLLLRHFFAVAIYGVGDILKPFPTRKKIKRSYSMMRDAVNIVEPLVMNEKPDVLTRSAFKIAGALF